MQQKWLSFVLLTCYLLFFEWRQPALADHSTQFYKNSVGDKILRPVPQNWSFSGIFGVFDKAQLQRGLKIYTQVCAACHALPYVKFKDLEALDYDADQLRIFSSQFQIQDGVNDKGEPIIRKGRLSDGFPLPFENEAMAKQANQGALPPALTLLAQKRVGSVDNIVSRLFHYKVTVGSDYIYSLLTGYQAPPENFKMLQGKFYNPYFISGPQIAMPPPLHAGIVHYDDGTPMTVEQYAKDVSAFLSWTADPHMVERKKLGFKVLIFLIVLTIVFYLLKRRIWRKI